MDFTELVVLLILAPLVLAKLARLVEAKRQARNEHHSDYQEPSGDVPENLPSKRHGHKGRRSRRRRNR